MLNTADSWISEWPHATETAISAESQDQFREQLFDRFEAAWRTGTPPRIEDFLPKQQEEHVVILRELVALDLQYRLMQGEPVRVEQYLDRFPSMQHDQAVVVDWLETEFQGRREHGPELSLAEYRRRFPRFVEALAERLNVNAPTVRPARPKRFPIRLNCPHCRNPITIVDDEGEDVTCPSCGSSFRLDPDRTVSWAPSNLPTLENYHLLEPVGRGAFGSVYKAKDTELDRLVAVKLPRSGSFSSQANEDRFLRAARSVAQLRHPGIVSVHRVGRSDGQPFIVSEFVDGITLTDALSAQGFSPREAAVLILQLAEALEHAHRRGVIHRDLKPSNVMLDRTGSRVERLSFAWERGKVRSS